MDGDATASKGPILGPQSRISFCVYCLSSNHFSLPPPPQAGALPLGLPPWLAACGSAASLNTRFITHCLTCPPGDLGPVNIRPLTHRVRAPHLAGGPEVPIWVHSVECAMHCNALCIVHSVHSVHSVHGMFSVHIVCITLYCITFPGHAGPAEATKATSRPGAPPHLASPSDMSDIFISKNIVVLRYQDFFGISGVYRYPWG
jgi:hypothetical protein